MLNILIVQALECETIDLMPVAGCRFVHLFTGCGKVQAAVSLAHALSAGLPDVVVNLGSAGTSSFAIGDILVCRRFVDRDLRPLAALGVKSETQAEQGHAFVDAVVCGERDALCSTGDNFVTDALPEGDVCDMEAFAMAEVCNRFGVPFVSVKYITDVVGQNSIKAWEDKLADARTALTAFFSKKLSSFAG